MLCAPGLILRECLVTTNNNISCSASSLDPTKSSLASQVNVLILIRLEERGIHWITKTNEQTNVVKSTSQVNVLLLTGLEERCPLDCSRVKVRVGPTERQHLYINKEWLSVKWAVRIDFKRGLSHVRSSQLSYTCIKRGVSCMFFRGEQPHL